MPAEYAIDENGCWVWQGRMDDRGYGLCFRDGHQRAHRLYWAEAHGPIPEGFHVHHKCKNRACVNPDHLEAVDPRDHFKEHYLKERGRDVEFVLAIREAGRQPGASYRKVAKEFGVHFNTVRRYWEAETWADLGDGPVVTPDNICELDGCENPCVGKRHKRFCSSSHRGLYHQRKARERAKAA